MNYILDNPQSVRFVIFSIGFTAMALLETIFTTRVWLESRTKRMKFHIILSIVNTLLMNFLVSVPIYFSLVFVSTKNIGLSNILGFSGFLEIIISIILYDFVDYLWHRLNHVNNFLWRFHRVHHMDTHLDVTTSLRFHPVELLFSTVVKMLWILLWGPSLWGFVLSQTLITSFSQFHHANISFNKLWESRLRKIIMTPRLHTSHHSWLKKIRSKNYSTIFIIWDKIFSSYFEPQKKDLDTLGLKKPREGHLSFKKTLTLPFEKKLI